MESVNETKKQQLGAGIIIDDKYRIVSLRRVSSDGFLYEAVNLITQEQILLKEYFPFGVVIRSGDDVYPLNDQNAGRFAVCRNRVLKEARIIRDFQNMPGIVRVQDYFESNHTAYCVLENYPTESLLSRKIGGGQILSVREAFTGVLPVLEVLQKLHESGLIHRSISPEAIRITGKGIFQICDFGLPREVDEETKTRLIRIDEATAYLPPERMGKDMKQGPWSDIYSVSAVLYYCVMGREPVSAYERILGERLSFSVDGQQRIEAALEDILIRGMELDPSKRYQNVGEMIQDIRRIYPENEDEQRRKRSRKILKIGGTAVACVVLGLVVFFRIHPEIVRFWGQKTETILVKADGDASTEDWNIIRERAKVFAGDSGYVWKKKGNDATIIFPASLFEENGSGMMISYYLTDPWHLKVSYSDSAGVIRDYPIQGKEAEVISGEMPGLDRYLEYSKNLYTMDQAYLEKKAQETALSYVRVKIDADTMQNLLKGINNYHKDTEKSTKAYQKSLLEMLETETDDLVKDGTSDYAEKYTQAQFEMQYENIDWYRLPFHLEKGSDAIDITGYMQSEPFSRLMGYNLTHDGPSANFTVSVERKVIWEEPKASFDPGQYQVSEDSFISSPVYLNYLLSGSTKIEKDTMGMWYRKFEGFKDMLDKLKTPYAIGVGRDNNREIVVKINAESIPVFYAEMLDKYNEVNWSCGWSRAYGALGETVLEPYETKEGREGFMLRQDAATSLTEDRFEQAKENGIKRIYLSFSGEEIAEGELSLQRDVDQSVFYFPTILLQNIGKMNMQDICDDLNALLQNHGGHMEYSLIGVQNVDAKGIPTKDQSGLTVGGFPVLSGADRAEVQKLADRTGMEVEIYDNIGNHRISFDNAVKEGEDPGFINGVIMGNLSDESFVEDGLEEIEMLIRNLLKIKGIRDGNWSGISFYIRSDKGKSFSCTLEAADESGLGEENTNIGKLIIKGVSVYSADGSTIDASDTAKLKRYLDSSAFFKQYGGSGTWYID